MEGKPFGCLKMHTGQAFLAVTERQPTPHIRRYINIIAEFCKPLYDFEQYQENPTPWALMMGGAEKS